MIILRVAAVTFIILCVLAILGSLAIQIISVYT